ncbi:hypothetical protein B1757_12800 [Acidithiobacillus marinus]|uniref:Uncharacterized protein n=1 Tax=Acidithiobacillus marinus TaxID=187490 RepID=A0A2I1DIW8_9PROT|nr:hypothetical protein [Acidithiobacillus marinus]PKY09822.1 hypothetical protein B1757_12800 [Acidithiobacillus marinus]
MNISIHQSQIGRIAHIISGNGPRIEILLDENLPAAQALRHEAVRRPELAATLERAADFFEFGPTWH